MGSDFMNILQSIILGIIQGLTEFLPISSSGHLVIAPYIFGWDIPAQQGFIFDVLVQLGTLLAVIVYFWRDLVHIIRAVIEGLIRRQPFVEPDARLGWLLILGSIPAALGGVLFKDVVEGSFSAPWVAGLFLVGTAILLVVAEWLGKRTRKLDSLTWLDALLIGLFQVISLFPGISRSGATISGGMVRNLDRTSSARFSFLMSIPIMIGAGGVAVIDLMQSSTFDAQLTTLLVGFVVAAIVGYLSIRWLLAYLTKRRFYIFAVYCLLVSVVVLITSFVRA
jgi:undecaprenyl-diphosphatase